MPKQKTDNRSVGTRFEAELCEILAQHGFWAHNMQQNSAGQPADIIAVRGAFHTLIDCKHIADDSGFPFSQIRENQRSAMKMFQKKCHEFCYFAFKLPDDTIWLITLERMDTLAGRGKQGSPTMKSGVGRHGHLKHGWTAARHGRRIHEHKDHEHDICPGSFQ